MSGFKKTSYKIIALLTIILIYFNFNKVSANLLLEVNIFGINKNLYNKVIKVDFLKFIRAEKKFKNLEHLKKQINIRFSQKK